jgi:hypothetical protein
MSELFQTVAERDGADTLIGRRLPTLLREAGLVNVGVEARADVYPPGHTRRLILPDLVRSMRPIITNEGFLSAAELDELDREVRTHLANPNVLVLDGLFFLAWGQKPSGR